MLLGKANLGLIPVKVIAINLCIVGLIEKNEFRIENL
jgi:hypothetical protein